MSYISELPSRIQAAESEAARGSGQSDVLYHARVNEAYEALIDEAPEEDKAEVEAMLRERGYDPDEEPFTPGENECSMTGINVDCCPCGNHE